MKNVVVAVGDEVAHGQGVREHREGDRPERGAYAIASVIAGSTLWRAPRPSPSTRRIVKIATVTIAQAGARRGPS